MEIKDLVSIIIPVYNAQEFLPECIDSIINQNYNKIEIIVVDDGSDDNSALICRQYAERDRRIVLIRQENQGNTNARKKGLSVANGEYVVFVDADDYVKPDMIEALYHAIRNSDADVAVSNVIKLYAYGEIIVRNRIPEGVYDNMDDIIPDMFYYRDSGQFGVLPYLYAKIYRREFINQALQTLSDDMQYAEDRAVMFWCIINARRVVFIDAEYYYYRIHDNSICTTKDEEYLIKLTRFYLYCKKLFNTCAQSEHLLRQLDKYMVDGVIYGINQKIGLSQNDLIPKYCIDEERLPASDKVILYGAGAVGRDYYRQLVRSQKIKLVAWIDYNDEKYVQEGLDVEPVTRLEELEYDYVLVAVLRKEIFENISKTLEKYAVENDKVMWIQPKVLF